MWLRAVVCSALLVFAGADEDLKFPPGFKFGAASAAYQVEGGWNASDKGENIWDRFTHEKPERIVDLSNGDVACDSYNNWRRDIEIAQELGLHFYRFSISWTRVLPSGFPTHISEDGKNYYNNLIDGLLEKGIEPLVTVYHWDLPQSIQGLGGWTNPLIVDWFADYARVVYNLFGDRVKRFLTINEPIAVCDVSYASGIVAPGILSPDIGVHLCNKHVLLAHAKAWRIYDEEFKPKYHGKVSLANQFVWFEPVTEEDTDIAEMAMQSSASKYADPIFSKEGGWPAAYEKAMEDISKKKGYPKSVLPAFTEEEKEFVKGTYDYLAFNHYTSRRVRRAKEGEQLKPGWPLEDNVDLNIKATVGEDWVYPEGIRKQLNWLKKNYGDVEIAITENGYATLGGLEDHDAVAYYRDYLTQVLKAIKEDGVNVTHYTAWTIMDNFEWMDGYASKFGLYEVDFNDPRRTRTPRASAKYYASVAKSRSLDVTEPAPAPVPVNDTASLRGGAHPLYSIFYSLLTIVISLLTCHY